MRSLENHPALERILKKGAPRKPVIYRAVEEVAMIKTNENIKRINTEELEQYEQALSDADIEIRRLSELLNVALGRLGIKYKPTGQTMLSIDRVRDRKNAKYIGPSRNGATYDGIRRA